MLTRCRPRSCTRAGDVYTRNRTWYRREDRGHSGGSKRSGRAWEWRFKGPTWVWVACRVSADGVVLIVVAASLHSPPTWRPCACSNGAPLAYIRPFYVAFTLFGPDSNLILWITRPVRAMHNGVVGRHRLAQNSSTLFLFSKEQEWNKRSQTLFKRIDFHNG